MKVADFMWLANELEDENISFESGIDWSFSAVGRAVAQVTVVIVNINEEILLYYI